MFPNMHEYYKAKNDKRPPLEVTEAELVEMLMVNGCTKEKAEFQVNVAKTMGAVIRISGRSIGIKKNE